MSWVLETIAVEDEHTIPDRLSALRAEALEAVPLLGAAADFLAASPAHSDTIAALRFATALSEHREELILLCGLAQRPLSDDLIERIRKAFALAEMAGDEHSEARRDMTVAAAGRPVESLRELSDAEALDLIGEIQRQERPF